MSYEFSAEQKQPSKKIMDDGVKMWPGRQEGNEGEWRAAIREWDATFHQWMKGKIDDTTAWNAYEDFNDVLQDHYLSNELTAQPEFPRYGTKNLRDEEQYCSKRGNIMQGAIRLIDKGEGCGADDLSIFRNAMCRKYQRVGLYGDFVDVDYSTTTSPTFHCNPG